MMSQRSAGSSTRANAFPGKYFIFLEKLAGQLIYLLDLIADDPGVATPGGPGLPGGSASGVPGP